MCLRHHRRRLRRTAVRGTSSRPGIRPRWSGRWRNWAASASSRSMSGSGRCSDSSSPSTPPRWSTSAASPTWRRIDRETVMTAAETQANPPWGLDRIDQAALPLDHGVLLRRYWRRREAVRDRLRAADVACGVHRAGRQRLVLGLRRRHGDLGLQRSRNPRCRHRWWHDIRGRQGRDDHPGEGPRVRRDRDRMRASSEASNS